ncbi:glutathione peroxidase (macronuclear) [Tetrahymena thermophila SB210]|uniref:Glutathione peroxidase n=1 Tax=Tetrahymena thermophila (strain SB210) TaxID=312017 RepID=I7MK93_TETTS|nr:glutathione peroxidase [Tetrahymena thermophila SB210]EAR97894.2 glutathione peroxidase [Tetrahymena thermophila SB210]|eukprot:XP_001018139.2 glutathione peroxidase [Tetrahymena thermophila SB210]
MDSTLTQDVQSSNPQAMNKFENTKRKKPWEVFKKQTIEEEKPESVQQFDSFRDKCAHNMQSGAGFTAFLNNAMQQDNNFQIKLNKNQYYQNLNKNKKLFGLNNYQSTKSNKQGGGNQSRIQEDNNQPRFNAVVKNNFEKQSNYHTKKNDETKENTNNQNFNKQNTFHFNPFNKHEQQHANQELSKDVQHLNKDEISKAKYLERKQKKVSDLIEQQASRALRREEGENIPSDEDPLMNYLSDSSSNESDGEGNKKKTNLSSSQKKKRSGLTRRRQKICGSWVRVCDTQKLDKPPSYKDYLGALTNAKGKRPLEELNNKDDDLYEVNKELAQDAEDGELKAVADLEDGEIKMQEEDFFLKNNADIKFQQELEFPFPTRKIQQKPHKSKNFMNISPTKILNTLRKTSLLDEEDEATYKKKQKIPTKEELLEQENKLLENQSQQIQDSTNPLQLLKKMDQLGNEAFKNRTGNNFQMQQTLAAQQDLFLHSYFNKSKHKGENLNQEGNAAAAKKEKRFDPKNYYIDIEKNMIDNNVQMTEGLLALAKIQKEQYVSGVKKKTKQNKDILSGSNFSSGSGSKINKILQQDSTEKELRDASQRLTKQAGMKDLQSKLNFDQNNSHPLLLQKEKQNEQFNKALNKYEEEVNKKEELIKQIQQQKKKEEKMNQNTDQATEEAKQQGKQSDDATEANAEAKEGEEMDIDDEDLNEFEKFNEEYLKQQEKMLEEIQKKNKEKVNEIKNSKSLDLGLGLEFGLDYSQKEEQLNPLEKMIQEELERNRQDKQQQNFRLMELQKLQGNQHIQHAHLLAKSTVNETNNSYKNLNDNPYAKITQQNLYAMSNNPTDNQNNKRRNKFSEIPTLPAQFANVETFAQMERLKQLTQAQKSQNQTQIQPPQQTKKEAYPNEMTSLSQLQQQLFTKNQQLIKQEFPDRSKSKMELEHQDSKSSKFSSQIPTFNLPQINNKNEDNRIQQEEQKPIRKISFDKSVNIPENIKSMEMQLKPEKYEKMVLEYINMYKKQKEEIQIDKIKDPRLRARATNNFEEKIQQFASQLVKDYTEKINNYIPMANEDNSLPLPSIQDDSGNKRKTSLLSFSVETSTMPAQGKQEVSDDKVVYNYKVLKSERNFITQEKNLIEKHSALSFLQGSSQGPDQFQLLRMPQKEESTENQNDEFKDLFKNEKELRYFKENKAITCFKCHRNGHTAQLCTNQSEERSKCVFCLGDHSKDYCTNYVCFKCYLVGHRIKDCAFEQSMDQSRCRICRKKGHTLKQCGSLNLDIVQKSYDFYSMNETICLNCREPGHINCFNPQLYINYDGLYKLDQETLDKLF